MMCVVNFLALRIFIFLVLTASCPWMFSELRAALLS